jgi:Fe-S-cluster containining protein
MGSRQTPAALLPLTVRCLSVHADYACRHSGACCTAGWRIPIDDGLRETLRTAREQERLTTGPIELPPAMETSPCQFYASDSRRCTIHRDLGPEYKPSSCRHFPRVALLDARGVSLTLSHFCPTAAAMLFRDDVSLAVVQDPPAFPAADDYEGLDAREVMPPLLHPGMLWDLDGYSAWEEEAVAFLGRSDLGPESALAHLRNLAQRIEEWRPGGDSLRAHIEHAFRSLDECAGSGAERSAWGAQGRVVSRYLAARLFASWVPYRADRLTALVDDLQRTVAILKEEASRAALLEAIRATDLRVVHRA